ncbi:extracellular solute-binding protein [Paenibacillus pinisoli]|uniref:Extracellular solute-binding protein n=1 Tax=Paenibacillus pinisoli TaxID=1276110 RepID=A0A3A6PVI1_9BACL|nr:extracellular solute-binding protein [Paenibacillus pinisoli]RJX37874.1 extracellular solute-binding protein [Paenibacillus pinisoli]
MMKKKSLLLIVSAVLLFSTMLAACSNSGSNTEKPSPTAPASNNPGNNGGGTEEPKGDAWEFGSEPLSFSLYYHYNWADFLGMDEYPATKWLKENKQLDIKAIQANGSANDVMATMIVGNKLPDVIWMDRFHQDFDRLYQAGQLVPLDDYLEKYPNLLKWAGKEKLDLLRSPDGKLYKFPNWYTDKSTNTAGYAINKKIHREMGSPTLETIDDLYKYLVDVKAKYGDQVIPFEPDRAVDGQGVGVLYTAFKEGALYDSVGRQLIGVPNGDKLTSLFTDPAFRESQKFVSKLYREKLMTQDAFTQTDEMVTEKLLANRVAVYASSNVTQKTNLAHSEIIKENPDDGYFVIWPFHKAGLDKNKIYPGGYDKLGWNVAVITKNAKDPEKIFAFLDWFTGPDGMNLQFFGPEGKNWKGYDGEGSPIFTDQFDPVEVADIQTKNTWIQIVGNTSYIDPAKMKMEERLPEKDRNWQAKYQSEITWPTGIDITEFKDLTPPTDSEEANIQTLMTELLTQVLAESSQAKSDSDVDKILDKAEADAKKSGYERLLEWRTEQWQAKRKILGLS